MGHTHFRIELNDLLWIAIFKFSKLKLQRFLIPQILLSQKILVVAITRVTTIADKYLYANAGNLIHSFVNAHVWYDSLWSLTDFRF